MKKNDTIAKFKLKTNKIERLFILAFNNYFNTMVCPEFNEDDKFNKYVFYGELISNNPEEEEYKEFDMNNLPKEYVKDLSNVIDDKKFKELISNFTDTLVQEFNTSEVEKSIKAVSDFINDKADRFFTLDQVKEFLSKIEFEKFEYDNVITQIEIYKVRFITFNSVQKFVRELVKVNKDNSAEETENA